MHVCHLCDTTFESAFFRNIVGGLTRRGIHVSLVELASGSPPTWLGDFPGVSYRCLNAASKIGYPIAAWRLAQILKNEKVDILHTHLYHSGLVGVLTKRFQARTKVAVMRHHSTVVHLLGSRVHILVDRWMAEKADHVMTVSEAARKFMLETDKIRRDDIEVVHIGFDFETLAPNHESRQKVRHQLGFKDDNFVIGYVANFVPGKGHIQLVAAFEKIAAEIPDARLVFAGDRMLSEVKEAARRIGEDKVVFAGWRDEVPAFLIALDLFVQPSLSEAFSQVLIEAMGVGLPVVATRVGGACEVIEDQENGILVEPDEPNAIYREVVRLYNDPDLRLSIAEKGRQSVKERFPAQKMVGRLVGLYEKWSEKG